MNKAWEDLGRLNPPRIISLKLLADEYTLDCAQKRILSLSCNIPAKDFTAIIILHYLCRKLAGLPGLTGEWMSFKKLAGIEGYAAAFRKRVIQPIIAKYGRNPEGIFSVIERLPAKKVNQADAGIVLEVLEGVPALVTLWRGDEEFGPEANMLFDKSIREIFCIEDIVVLAGFVSAAL